MNKNKVLVFLLALIILLVIVSLSFLLTNFYKQSMITISSNIPGYEVKANKNLLEKNLLEIGYWNDNSISHFRNYKLKVKATKLTVSFLKLDEKLSRESYHVQKDNNGNEIITIKTDVNLNTGEQTVDIGIGQSLLNGSIENPSQWIDNSFWNAIYITFKHVPPPQGGINQVKLTEFLDQQLQKGQIFNLGIVK